MAASSRALHRLTAVVGSTRPSGPSEGISNVSKWDTLDSIKSNCTINEHGCWIPSVKPARCGYVPVCERVDGGTRNCRLHRRVCRLAHGEPPTSDHHAAHGPCHNRACCNPEHLSWKTPIGNAADKVRDGTRQHGKRNPNATLTKKQVRAIKAAYVKGSREFGSYALGREYGVRHVTILRIVNGKNWTHILN